MTRAKKVHFMGIGGSGMSAVAQISKAQGYTVTGCDLNLDTPYIDQVKKAGIPITSGHDPDHLEGVDILAVTPAVFYQNNAHPEVETARAANRLMKWQQFLGQYLHEGKTLIAIAGTHGKSTTTALTGLTLEAAGLDPTVEVGAKVKEWQSNVRIGQSDLFVSEADEFDNNFEFYHPRITILNNIEMDHPEYFSSVDRLLKTFEDFLAGSQTDGAIIYNTDSPLNNQVIKSLSGKSLTQKLIPFSLTEVAIHSQSPAGTDFSYQGHLYHLTLPGLHNVSNALGIIQLAGLLDISPPTLNQVFQSFSGIGRRLELIGTRRGITVYDDYANHPTAFAATIAAVKQLHPESRVWAVVEPHTYSRLRALLPQLPASLSQADYLVVSRIFASREQDPGDFSGADIVGSARHPRGRYIPEFLDIATTIGHEAKSGDVILVMGSGHSYKLSRQIHDSL